MKKGTSILSFFLLICLFPCPGNSQAIVQNDTVYFPETHPTAYEQLVYKIAPQIDELSIPVNENLALRVYFPDDLEPGEKRPLVVLVHGGGFIGGSFGSFFDEAEYLAQLGFVAASVQYRLCKRGDCLLAAGLSFPCNVSWANSLIPSAYVAATDVADAIRWLQENSTDYYIDPEKIVVGGHSAGGWTSVHLAFMDIEEINEVCPSCGTWPDYLADSLVAPTGIRAIINMSGAILDTLWMDSEEADIDLMTIHGTHDGVVPYGTAPVYPCCNTYSTQIQGACPLTARHRSLGGDSYLLTGQDFGHDVFTADWWEVNEEQILWFLGKSLFSDIPYQKHSVVQRSAPVTTCPPPFPPIDPGNLCGLPESEPGVVLFEEIPTGISTAANVPRIRLFPNPVVDRFFVDVDFSGSDRPEQWELSVYNSLGDKILTQTIYTFTSDVFSGVISLPDCPTGIYFVECRLPQEVFFREKILIVGD